MDKNVKVNYIKWVAGIIVLAILIWGGYALFTKKIATNRESINIGIISGLTGEFAAVGENYKNGAVLAYEDFTKNNPNIKVKLSIEDDNFNEQKGLSAYIKLTSINHIQALINLTSPTIDAIYNTVIKDEIPVIQLGEQSKEPTGDNVFQILPGNIAVNEGLGEFVKNRGAKNVALVYTNQSTILRFVDAFKKGFGSSVSEFQISSATKDYRTVVAKIVQTNPDIVAIIAFPEQGAQLVKQYLTISKNKPLFVFDPNFQSGFNDYKRILGDINLLSGDIVMAIQTHASDKFANLYKQRFSSAPGFGADLGYDAFNLLMSTYSSNATTWVNKIKKIQTDGVTGAIKFDDVGVRLPDFKPQTIKNGSLVDFKQ